MKKNHYWLLFALACTGGLGAYLYHRHQKNTADLTQVISPLAPPVFSSSTFDPFEDNSSISETPSSRIENTSTPSPIKEPLAPLARELEEVSVPILIPNEYDDDEEEKILKFRQLATVIEATIPEKTDEKMLSFIVEEDDQHILTPIVSSYSAESTKLPEPNFAEKEILLSAEPTSPSEFSLENDKSVFDEIMDYAKQFPEFIIPGKDIQRAEPAILFAYANHLYTLGRKAEATFWFYFAQFRTRYLTEILKTEIPVSNTFFVRFFRESGFVGNLRILSDNIFSESPEVQYQHLNTVYDSATRQNILTAAKGLGEVINNYAYQNIHKQVQRLQDVLHFEQKFPFQEESLVHPFDLIPPIDRVEIKEQIAREVEEAQQWLLANYDRVREVRRQRGLPND